MATAKKPVVQQTVELPGSGRLVYKSDKKWYFQTVTGGVVVSESPITAAEANKLKGTPAERGAVSPGGGQPARVQERPTTPNIQKELTALEKLTPNSSGLYVYKGQELTKTQYQNEVDRLRGIIGERQVAGTQAQKTQAQTVQAERDRLVQYIADFTQQLNFAQAIVDNSTDTEAVRRANAWVKKLSADQKKLTDFLKAIDTTGRLPTSYVLPEIPTPQQIQSGSPTGPEVPATGPGQYGVMPSTSAGQVAPTGPVPAGQRGEQAMGAAPTTPSRMPTLDEVNKQRTAQGLRALVVRNGRVVDPTTGQEVPNVSTTAPGQGAVVTPTVPGGGTGGAAVGGTPAGTVPPAAGTQLVGSNGQVALIPPSWEEAARMEAGAWWDIFKDNEEMRKFIADWMARPMVPGADPFGEAFDLALRKTNWWRTTSATVRSWTELEASDPATASARLEANISVLKKLAMDRGLSTDEALLRKAGLDVSKFGLSPEVALNNLASGMLQTSTGASELRQGFYGQSVRQLANKYGIAMSDSAITNNAGQVATGQQTLASLEAQFREQAKIMYPSLAGGLDRGLSFQDMASPYARYASSILEIPEEQIDFTDPKWSAAFNTRDDKGNLSQMSFSEWADYLRKDPQFGWEYTDNAKSQVYDIALQIGRMFGRAG